MIKNRGNNNIEEFYTAIVGATEAYSKDVGPTNKVVRECNDMLGSLLLQVEQPRPAKEFFDKSRNLLGLARACEELGEHKEAIVYAETQLAKDILEAGEDHHSVKQGKLRLSKLWEKAGDTKAARRWCEEAGDSWEVLQQKANLLSLSGDHSGAVEVEKSVQQFLALSAGRGHELVRDSGERLKAFMRKKIELDLGEKSKADKKRDKKKRQKQKKKKSS